MTVVNFTKKRNVLTGGRAVFGRAESTDSRVMGVWTDARTHGRNFELFLDAPFQELIPPKKG